MGGSSKNGNKRRKKIVMTPIGTTLPPYDTLFDLITLMKHGEEYIYIR
jgi:hypothetical protein